MRRRSLWVAAGLVIVAAFASSTGFFFYRDNFSTHYPIKVLSAESFRSGEIPYWNFADDGGQPLAGNPNTLTFYPDNILYLVLPAHVAFNLHFLIHLAAAFFAMRALTRSNFGGALWALSGIAISATAFYNLIVAVAVVPLAFVAAERRSRLLLGASFGLLILAGEPVTIIGAAIGVAIIAAGRMRLADMITAGFVAMVVGSPQLIAYSEIAFDVERSVGMSPRTVLNASLPPIRVAELFFGPLIGFLNDPGNAYRARLFSTVFVGLIAIPALMRRSRYLAIAAVMLFLALGRFNPLVVAVVEGWSTVRIVRFPEKFALPLAIALVVLAAGYFRETRFKRAWLVVTFVPLIWVAWRAVPIAWFAPYRMPNHATVRVHVESRLVAGRLPAREEYRLRAAAREPLFGAVAGLRYGINPSPEGMHALRSRMVVERFAVVPPLIREKYLRVNGCNVPGALPAAYFPAAIVAGGDIYRQTAVLESPIFDDQTTVVAPDPVPVMPAARVLAYREAGQTIVVDVAAPGEALLVINQTWFPAWYAATSGSELITLPVNIDRLGVVVPEGRHRILLRFGRLHAAVAVSWLFSSAMLIAAAFAKRVEEGDRRAGEIERSADEDGGSV